MTPLEAVLLGVALGSQILAFLAIRQTRRTTKLLDISLGADAPDWKCWRQSNARWRERAIRAERREFGAAHSTIALLDYVNFPEEEG